MTSRERILATIAGTGPDHVPLTTWCFGFPAPPHLRWETAGRQVAHWYSMRMEHIHTMPEPWGVEDDFKRVLAWQSLGLDDVLDVAVPWSTGCDVTWEDSLIPAGKIDRSAVLVREYQTPAGTLRHAIRKTDEEQEPGWVIQPSFAQLFEDLNVPRGVEHAVSGPGDVPAVQHLYQGPDEAAGCWFTDRLRQVGRFAERHGVAVQAWSAFGMDAAVWLAGPEGAVMLAMDEPQAFGRLLDIIAQADFARTQLAAASPGVDIVVQRGWYSGLDFWSPRMFDQFVCPHLAELVRLAHRHGKKFAYVVTTGTEALGQRLIDAGVDVLYFVDPVQDAISPERAREIFGGRMAVAGGVNALTLARGDPQKIRDEVRRAMDGLAQTGRFILHPVDALFPDTPWEGVEAMIEEWKACTR